MPHGSRGQRRACFLVVCAPPAPRIRFPVVCVPPPIRFPVVCAPPRGAGTPFPVWRTKAPHHAVVSAARHARSKRECGAIYVYFKRRTRHFSIGATRAPSHGGAPDSLRLRLRLRLGRAAQREDARAQGPTALAANAEAQTQGTHTVGRGLPARARSGRQRGPRDRVSRPAGWAALHCHQDSGGLTAAVRVLGGHEAEFPELGAEDPSVASF